MTATSAVKGIDLNGTYLALLGWPLLLTFGEKKVMHLFSNGKGDAFMCAKQSLVAWD